MKSSINSFGGEKKASTFWLVRRDFNSGKILSFQPEECSKQPCVPQGGCAQGLARMSAPMVETISYTALSIGSHGTIGTACTVALNSTSLCRELTIEPDCA